MADEKYTLPENPEYKIRDIRKLQNSDPANADTTFNPTIQPILESVEYLKREKADKAEVEALDDQKVEKEAGKGLSSNDYTSAEKTKLAGIAEGANKTTVDTALSATSVNPVQNKAAKAGIDAVQANLTAHTGNKSNPHGVTASQVGAAAASHTHSDKLSLSGGTMTGQLKAQSNTAYSTAQVRNIIVSTTDLEPGVSSLENGTLYLVYEE